MTDTETRPTFSVQGWADFWAAPDMSQGQDVLAEDIVGYWPGDHEPVRGLLAYAAKMADLLAAYPDIRLELVDSATVPANAADEELVFLHYVGQGHRPGRTVRVPRARSGPHSGRHRDGERRPLRPVGVAVTGV